MNLIMEIILYILVAITIHVFVFLFVSKKTKKDIKGRHVVVTGGSSGIGFSVAVICALKGAHVTVVARNIKLLENVIEILEKNRQTPEQKFQYKSIDISTNYIEVASAFAEIEEIGPIYMLVNCAGMAICGIFEEVSIDDAKKMMDINYYGTYYCTRYVLPKMKAARDGIIVITASQGALLGVYGYGPYAATKFALRGMAETISMECKHFGVCVTLALPADTDTPGFENEEKSKPKETKIISESGGLAKAEDVAKRIVEDALSCSFFSILGFESWILTILCCGMAPWGNLGLNIVQVLLMGPFRIVGLFLQMNFSRIIKRCAKENDKK